VPAETSLPAGTGFAIEASSRSVALLGFSSRMIPKPTLSAAVPNWGIGDSIYSAQGGCGWSGGVRTTQTSRVLIVEEN
jgi:hypothetical protein